MTPNRRSTAQKPLRHRKAPSPAWPAFESKLAEALAVLEEDQYLVISEKRGEAYVQFAGQGSFGVRAECVSNNYLDEAHALRAGQMTALERIGWSAPTGTPAEASPKRQPEGSPNFFRDFGWPVPYDAVARMAVRSLAGVFAFDKSKRSILIPTLGLMREPPAVKDNLSSPRARDGPWAFPMLKIPSSRRASRLPGRRDALEEARIRGRAFPAGGANWRPCESGPVELEVGQSMAASDPKARCSPREPLCP